MPYILLDNRPPKPFRLYYETHGEGEPVVFLHGFTLDRRMWQPQIEPVSSHYKMIVVDARGHGLSEAPSTGYSRNDRVEDLRALADKLNIERFHLVGLSMGGATGIGFALKSPERLHSLTLASTGAAGYDIGKKISLIDKIAREKGVDSARIRWLQISTGYFTEKQAGLKELMTTMIKDHSGAIWLDPMRGKYPREYDLERVSRIKIPTLIISGEKDKIFTGLAGELHERMKSSRLITLKDTGHMVNLEKPDDFNRHLLDFLSEVAE